MRVGHRSMREIRLIRGSCRRGLLVRRTGREHYAGDD